MPPVLYRYDIVEVIISKGKLTYAQYWRNAFDEDRRSAWEIFPSITPELEPPEDLSDPDQWQFFDI